MLNRFLFLAILGCSLPASFGATVQMKDKSAVTGKIIAEKKESVVVDLGFTVLIIPRNQIVRILNSNSPALNDLPPPTFAPAPVTAPAKPIIPSGLPESKPGFFSFSKTPPPEKTVRDLVNQLGEAVVQVRTPGGLGSGFIINEDGFLITNFHVIEGETQISVEVYSQKAGQIERTTYKQVKIIAIHKYADLALLKIEDKGAPKFSRVSMGDSEILAVGERVFAIGSPLGLERTVTEGIVSTKTRPMAGELYLQTTAQINPGNSGGPLFNLRGEVIGVTNMKVTFGEGLGFAIPIEEVKNFLNHRDAYAYDNENPSNAYRYLPPPSRTSQRSVEK
ncbi:MAG: trypsin-like peptidase domain-containing protein [Verrucomicrobiota bacterium]|nr:trypsin-like peptidase domain-containing protein [Verrucomicrobiota bacterium]